MNLSLKKSVLLAVTVGIALIILVLMFLDYRSFKADMKADSVKMFDSVKQSFNNEVDKKLSDLSIAVEAIVENREANKFFAERDRDSLAKIYINFFKRLKENYGIAQFQYHTSPAISFLRLHSLKKFDDDLSSFRATVVESNTKKKAVTGLEVGRGGPGLRVVYPVFYEGEHLGSVEFGGSINSILENQAKVFGLEYAIGIYDEVFQKARRFDKEKTDVVKGKTVYYKFSKHGTELVKLYNDDSEVYDLGDGSYMGHVVPLKDFSGAEIGNVVFFRDFSGAFSEMKSKIIKSVITGLIMLVIALSLLYVLISLSMRAVNRVVDISGELASGRGDLTKRLPVKGADFHNITTEDLALTKNLMGKNELEDMSINVNTFLHTLDRDFTKTLYAMGTLLDKVMPIYDSIVNVRTITEGNLDISKSVAAAGEEMHATIAEIAQSTNDSASKADDAVSLAQEGAKVIHGATQSAEAVKENLGELSNDIDELVKNANEIGSVVEVINDISEQTNLLALNAAIEAARAGEAGRGFAVVADEVRKLAEKTMDSTSEIERMISHIQKNVKKAGENTKAVTDTVEEQVKASEKANDSFRLILGSIEELSSLMLSISSAVEQQSVTTQEIAQSIETVATSSEESKVSTNDMIFNINRLLDDLTVMEKELIKFKLSCNASVLVKGKIAHTMFLRRIYSNWIAGESMGGVSDHLTCDFGKMYYSEGQELFGHDSSFKSLESLHKDVHIYAKEYEKHMANKDREKAGITLKKFRTAVDKFIAQLDRLIEDNRCVM